MNGNQSSLAASVLVLGLTIGAHAEADKYVCSVEQAAGLHYEKQTNSWRPQAFGTGTRYLLRRLNASDRDKQKKGNWWALLDGHQEANWAFFEFGKELPMPLASCVEDVKSVLASQFFCRAIVKEGSFDKDSHRFELITRGGYIDQGFWEKERRDHPNDFKPNPLPDGMHDPSHPDDLFIEIGRCRTD
jgi:hypothetical protein